MIHIKRLFEILGKYSRYYVFSSLLLVVAIFVRMLEPKVLQIAVDKVIVYFQSGGKISFVPDDPITKFLYSLLPAFSMENLNSILIGIGIIFLAISLVRGAFSFTSSAITASSTEKAMKELRDRLFSHIQGLPIAYHTKTPTGELIQRCTGDVETIRKFAASQIVDVIRLSALFIGAFIMMATIDLQYALIAVAFAPLLMAGSILFFQKETKVWNQHELEQDKLSILAQENISGIRVVKAFAKEDFEIDKFTKQNEEKRKWGVKLNNLHRIFWPSSDMLVHTQMAITLFVGGYFTLTNRLSVGEFTAFYTYSMLVTWPMRRLGQLISEMGMATVALKRLYSILETEKEDYSGSRIDMINGEVVFENVTFKYEKDEKGHVLDNVSFTVKTGQKVALLGPTGAGKTTIISLMMRFFEPDSGTIMIDGKDIRNYSKEFLRKRIGVVLQKPFLFSTSIRSNIAYTKPDSHFDEIVEAAHAAKIHDVITDIFPQSYDTIVGEKGVTLSGGQKQRVTIARTLLKDPDILVLDDSTSAVDSETEYEIQKALRALTKNKTAFIIAHRITSIQDCDKIIVLDKGRVVEEGTHEELIRNEGFYKKIYDIQVSVEDEIRAETEH